MFISKSDYEEIMSVLDCLSKGDFEKRLVSVGRNSKTKALCNSINNVVDRCDAYIRESSACMEYVADNKYYKIL